MQIEWSHEVICGKEVTEVYKNEKLNYRLLERIDKEGNLVIKIIYGDEESIDDFFDSLESGP